MKKYKVTTQDGTSVILSHFNDLSTVNDIISINKLIKDEEDAIASYDLALSQTQNEECRKLYQHIRDEEVEHLEELNSLKSSIEQSNVDVTDAGIKVRQLHSGYAVVVERYWQQYKTNAFIERAYDSLNEANYACNSLELHDGISFCVIDCNNGYIRVN